MKYYIIEIQGNKDGTFAHIVTTADDMNHAESIYYDKLHYAAVSALPVHTVFLLDSDGAMYQSKTYNH